MLTVFCRGWYKGACDDHMIVLEDLKVPVPCMIIILPRQEREIYSFRELIRHS